MNGAFQSFRQKTVDPSRFAQVPRADIPRSVFNVVSAHKTTFDAGYLVPIYCDEVLPGDSHRLDMTVFTRLSTLIFPLMDNLYLESFFFFVPNRLVWEHWEQFMGQQANPGDSIDYVCPVVGTTGPPAVGSLFDYFGIPTGPQVTASAWNVVAFAFRAYNLIYNEWFRDENLQNSVVVEVDDGPDTYSNYTLLRRGKRHDYFTSSLPWTQKGSPVLLPLSGMAPVTGIAMSSRIVADAGGGGWDTTQSAVTYAASDNPATVGQQIFFEAVENSGNFYPNIYADLSAATGATINALRQSFAVQKLLERDARGGTRYTEILQAHFGVHPPDFRLQRPEYLGGGSSPVSINPVAQTSETATTPLGNLSGVGTGLARHGFSQSFTEHGFIIGLVEIRADLGYQEGLNRMWTRSTRYDYYWPEFAHLGEQSVFNYEIYWQASSADVSVFGYQERYGEYRYKPSLVTGKFKSGVSGSLDSWHLAQHFTSLPTLGSTFIQDTPPLSRVLAAGSEANGEQFLVDTLFSVKKTRAMPMYGVPGFIDRF